LEGGRPRQVLESAFPRLLHVVKLEGSTGCNSVSGDLSIGVQGFLVEGASRTPVDRISLSGHCIRSRSRITKSAHLPASRLKSSASLKSLVW